MTWTETLQESINYIEDHLLENITYEDVAKAVCISPYEYHRAFSFLCGLTVTNYIRNRRLSLAGQELLGSDTRITDLAMKYSYDTPESFTKAFTRFHGIAPSLARSSGAQLSLFQPLSIHVSMQGGTIMEYRIVELPNQTYLTLTQEFPTAIINEEDNEDIGIFCRECEKSGRILPLLTLRPEGKKDVYGICSPLLDKETVFYYGQGILVDEETRAFDEAFMQEYGYTLKESAPGTYVVFQCMGENADCIPKMWKRFYNEFLPQTGYEARPVTDFEIYYQHGKQGMFCELWIPIQKH